MDAEIKRVINTSVAPALMELTFYEDGYCLASEQPWQTDQGQLKTVSLVNVVGETHLSDLETSPLTFLLLTVFKSYTCP